MRYNTVLTVPQAAERAGKDPETIRRWIRARRLRAEKVGTQGVIEEGDLDALLGDDANVALHLASGDLFGRVTDDLVAPALLWSEVASAVRRGVSTGRVSADLGQLTLERVLTAGIHRRAGDELYRRAVDVATRVGWSTSYDAEYVALAQIERARLVTFDGGIRVRAAAFVEVVDLVDVLA